MGATATGQPVTNLQVQTASRSELERGDLFVASLPESVFVFGRIVATDLLLGSIEGAVLIYLYSHTGSTPSIPRAEKRQATDLLVAPILTNRLLWSRGYFETIANVEIGEGEELDQHCFKTVRGAYVDECANPIVDPPALVGWHELASYQRIDEQISDALGIERATL